MKAVGNGLLLRAGNKTAVPHAPGTGKAKSNEGMIGN